MSNNMGIIHLLNILNNGMNTNILERSFNDQGEQVAKPCSTSFIDELEKKIITNEDIDNKLCCAICQDSFKLGEKVIKLPCKDPHYFHYEAEEDICEGILPWLKDNNSCPICRCEFPEEEPKKEENVDQEGIPIPDTNFDDVEQDNQESINEVDQMMENLLQRLFTVRPIRPTELQPQPTELQPQPTELQPLNQLPFTPIDLRQTIYIPMTMNIPNNYDEDEDPDLQEAIRLSMVNS
jgi:hypothetical protein